MQTSANGVTCVSAVFCVAVGATGSGIQGDAEGVHAVASSFNGQTWSAMSLPAVPDSSYSQLLGVGCLSQDYCVAVGYWISSSATDGQHQELMETYDGASWSITATADSDGGEPDFGSQLSGISCVSDTCTAVGYAYVGGQSDYEQRPAANDFSPLVATLSGGTWSYQIPPRYSGSWDTYLTSVSCPTAQFCAAVGFVTTAVGGWGGDSLALSQAPMGGGEGPIAYETTNGTWGAADGSSIHTGPSQVLFGVSCANASACLAVGELFENGASPPQPFAESFDGSSWSDTSTPPLPTAPAGYLPENPPDFLDAVSCPEAGSCLAGGMYEATSDQPDSQGQYTPEYVPFTEDREGTAWTANQPPAPGGSDSYMNAVLALTCQWGEDCMAVGVTGAQDPTTDDPNGYWYSAGQVQPYALSAGPAGSPPTTVYEAPAVSLSGASPGSSSASVSGSVNPESEQVTNCQFDYGEDTSYGSSAPCTPSPGGGGSPVSVSGAISGLIPGTTYDYRLEATNTSGTGYTPAGSFVTTGSSAPTAVTGGGTFSYDNPVAMLGGTVNPHNSPTTYSFYWDTSSHNITSASQLSGYGHETPVQSIGNGTTNEVVSADIPVSNHVTYYVRLVASNALGTSIGSEQSFTVDAPEPSNVLLPYLQDSGGFDPVNGFELRCAPGAWRNTDGVYSIQWVYFEPDGSILPALGHTRSTNYPNDVYEVTQRDINQVIGCLVNAQSLDGDFYGTGLDVSPYGAAELSDQILVADPAVIPFPPWFKAAYTVLSTELTGTGLYGFADECAEFADVPGFGESLCLVAAGSLVAQYLFSNELNIASDPPDPNYASLALAGAGLPVAAGNVCARRTPGRTCVRLRRLARVYEARAARTAALVDALNVTRNRFMVARRKHNPNAMFAQAAAAKVYSGMVQAALVAEHQAGLSYARALRKAHIDVRASVGALRRVSLSRLVNSAPFRSLLHHGYTRASVVAALRFARRHLPLRSFDLVRVLSAPLPALPLTREYDTLDFTDLEALVATLGAQHAVPAATLTKLYAAIDAARAACTASARASSLRTLSADARHLKAGYRQLLSAAILPLAQGHDHTDPYPACTSG